MFRKKEEKPDRPGVEELKKALWYAEKGLTNKARIAAKEALIKLKSAEMNIEN